MLRAFFAIALDPSARRAASALVRALRDRSGGEQVRWVREENLHVTLRFLGNVEADRIGTLLARVGEQTAPLAPFEIRFGAVHAFPSPRKPRVVAVELLPETSLQTLASAVERGVVAAGLPAEERAFRAHLTLGRVRPRKKAPDVTGPDTVDADPVSVTEVVLLESELHSSGAKYTPLGSAPLSPAR
jgi:2'-5' RNA ligase